MSLFQDALLVFREYFTVNKLIVVCFAIIMYEFFVHQRISRFLGYVAGILLALLVPVSAAMLMNYQTGIYEHGFIWNLLPVVAVCAYAGVRFLWDMLAGMDSRGRGKYVVGILAVLGTMFLLGNQGRMQRVTLDEAALRSSYGKVAEALPEEAVLWGPRELMQWVRSRNGEIKLVYGLDMWDARAAAYDGDAYSPELIGAYEWMQRLEDFTYQQRLATDVELPVPKELQDEMPQMITAMHKEGVNVIVLPTITYERLAELIPTEYQIQEVAEYTLLRGND